MRMKPGNGWKQLSVPVWENAAMGVRIHTSGLVCNASGKDILCWCSMWPHSAEWHRHTLIAGENKKRGLMTLAMEIAGKEQIMTEQIWSDEPPNEPGWYWVRQRVGKREYVAERNPDGVWDIFCGSAYATDVTAADIVQFGPRVPDPETCARIERGE